MKKITLLLLLFVSSAIYSQTNGITYQALILNPNGENVPGVNNNHSPLANKNICLQFTITDAEFQTEYQETINVKTDEFGMVNTIIGSGRQAAGYASSFSDIYWDVNKKSLKVALDVNGQCLNFVEISDQPLTYVPFAFSAKNAENVTGVVPIENGGTNAITILGAKTNLGLENVDNTRDLNKPVSIANQLALNLKEDLINKSTNVTIDGVSDTKYPTVKAVKTYVDANASIGSAALGEEVARAKNAESVLSTNLNTEISRAVGAEATKEDLVNKSSSVIIDGNSDVKYPTVRSVKSYVDTNMTTGATALSAEVARAIAAEKNLSTELTAETETRAAADANLVIDLATETSRATIAEGTLTTNLASEVARASTAEATKEVLINKSTSIAFDANSDIKYPTVKSVKTYVDASTTAGSTALTTENNRATAAENVIATNLATEVTRAKGAEGTLTTGLAAEATRATTAENANATAITSEISRATAAELTKENAANKSTDGTFALNSDVKFPTEKAVKTYVDASASAGSSALTSEINRATAAEGILTTNLNTEAATRLANDNILTTNLATEATTRGTAVTTLTANLNGEATTRASADVVLTNDLAAEVTRATTAEGSLTTNLSTESTRATNAEGTLTTNLATEVTNRINADLLKEDKGNKSVSVTTDGASDTKYPSVKSVKDYVDASTTSATTDLNAEITRATGAETSIAGNLATETTRATAAEGVNAAAILTEKGRAQTAEGTLTTNLNGEATTRSAADVVLTDDLASEVSRATTAEGTLTTNLSAESTRATNAEGVLTTNLATEVTNRTNADLLKEDKSNKSVSVTTDGASDTKYPSVKSVKDYVDASTTSATTDLNAEITRATGAETTIAGNLATETTRATAAEGINSAAILTEKGRAQTAEATLTTNLNGEATTRSAADVVLTDDLAAEVTRATTAEGTLTTNLSTESTRATNAEGVLRTNLATEVTNRINADLLKENAANKSVDGTLFSNSDVKFPTEKAVKTYIDVAIAGITDTSALIAAETLRATSAETTIASNLLTEKSNRILADNTLTTNLQTEVDRAISAEATKEDLINKSTSIAVDGASNTKYPTAKAVKTYVDTEVTAIITLADGTIYLGNASNVATEVTLSGDVTIDNTGVSTIGASKVVSSMITDATIVNADVSTSAAIAGTKIDPYFGSQNISTTGNATVGGTLDVTGVTTFTAQPVLSSLTASQAVFTDTSKGLVSKSMTGTGDVVLAVSPALTGTPTAPTATALTNTTQLATTAFVTAAASSANFVDLTTNQTIGGIKTFNTDLNVNGLTTLSDLKVNGFVELSMLRVDGFADIRDAFFTGGMFDVWGDANFNRNIFNRGEITSNSFIKQGGLVTEFLKADGSVDATPYAPLASPALTGTPTAPTATAGTNTTQLATTAFVTNEVTALNTLADGKVYLGNASNVATEVTLSGEATIDNTGVVTLNNAAVIGKVLTGFTPSTSGTAVLAADSVLGAIQKIEGNKSTDVFADRTSDIKYPSAKAVQIYVDTYSTINAISTITADYTVLITDYTILSNNTASAFTLTLPAASAATGKVYVIRKTDETSNILNISPAVKMTETTLVSSLNFSKTIRIQSNGTSWYVID